MKTFSAHTRWCYLALAMLLAGCASDKSPSMSSNAAPVVDPNARWVLLPSINNTEVPQAGGRLDSIAASLLRVHGLNLSVYSTVGAPKVNTANDDGNSEPASNTDTSLFEMADRHSQDEAMSQAKREGARYAVAGSVDEWRYKAGLEGQPAAGVSLSIVDLSNGRVIWSGSAAETGASSQAVSALAQELVNKMLDQALSNARVSRR